MTKFHASLIGFTLLFFSQGLVNAIFQCIDWPSINKTSCNEALEYLAASVPGEPDSDLWVVRGEAFGNAMPARYLSSDGTCAVDVELRPGTQVGDTSPRQTLWQAGRRIVDECGPNQGGLLNDLGVFGNIIVSVEPYVPHVHCRTSPRGGPAPESCKAVLDEMPISNIPTTFIEAGQRTADDQVIVPKIYDSNPRTACKAGLQLNKPAIKMDKASTWDIWRGAIAVDAMCVRRGMSGVAFDMGDRQGLSISLTRTQLSGTHTSVLQLGGNSTEPGLRSGAAAVE